MAGTFGYELDPAKLTEEEKAEVRTQIETFKKYYSLIQDGTYYRLASPYENEEYTVWEFAAEDKSEALLGICLHKTHCKQPLYLHPTARAGPECHVPHG